MRELGLDEAALKTAGAYWTAREIAQQPDSLMRVQAVLMAQVAALEAFLAPVVTRREGRIILAGAGTSAFIGECLAPYLSARLAARVQAIATTDIVSAPTYYLQPDMPTLMVSFGRSGNSPESVAAVDIADNLVSDIRHLVITCNGEGELARRCTADNARFHAILLPPETHDRSFAMTSSFTGMMYAALAAFTGPASMAGRAGAIAAATRAVIESGNDLARDLAGAGFQRLVYLGSHGFQGLAREAALKLLELTDGAIPACFDSPMGFRHGPKTIVTDRTLIAIFLSNDPYTRRYDLDLLEELARDNKMGALLAISAQPLDVPAGVRSLIVPGMVQAADIDLMIPFIAGPQMLAFHQSLALGRTPDNPNPSGTVNRVVQGVRIHKVP